MSGNFAQLLQVAKANSESSNREAQEALRRREDAQKKAREEQARKEREERELQKRLVLKKIEDQKREEERRKQREEEAKKRKDEHAKKREAEAAASKFGNGGGGSSTASGSRASKASQGFIVTNSSAMTREEKRMARDPLFADRVKRSSAGTKKRRDGRLPGGAIDGSGDPDARSSANSTMSAKARITNFAPTLTKLNTEKRDLRSIDEIARDIKRKNGVPTEDNVLKGDDAAGFSNWFGSKKDHSASGSTSPRPPAPVKASEKGKAPNRLQSPIPSKAVQRPGQLGKSSLNGTSKLNPHASNASPNKKAGQLASTSGKTNGKTAYSKSSTNGYAGKRTRDESEDEYDSEDDYDSEEDDRYHRGSRGGGGGLNEEQRREIWKLMGKNRDAYTSRNVDSDDDMEATGWELEREERISARIARKEDDEAEAEEKRREMEKKRRKLKA